MGKLLLAVAAALTSMSFTAGPTQRMTQAEIILSPSPPVAGQTMRIHYTGRLPATIDLDWHPKGSPKSVTVPARPGYVDITVPAGASSLIASDPTGDAAPASTVVL